MGERKETENNHQDSNNHSNDNNFLHNFFMMDNGVSSDNNMDEESELEQQRSEQLLLEDLNQILSSQKPTCPQCYNSLTEYQISFTEIVVLCETVCIYSFPPTPPSYSISIYFD